MQPKCWASQSVIGVSQTLNCCAAILVTGDANSAGQVECARRRLLWASILRLWDFFRLHSCSAYPKGKIHSETQMHSRIWNTSLLWSFLGWCLLQDFELFSRWMGQFILLWYFQRQLEALGCGRSQFQAGTFHLLHKNKGGNFKKTDFKRRKHCNRMSLLPPLVL